MIHPPGSRTSRAAGFALVDVLGGFAVLTISILAAVQSQMSSFAVTRASRELCLAAADLEAAMESLLALPADEIPVPGSEYEAGQPVARFTNLHLPGEVLTATYPGFVAGGAVPDQLIVVLTLSWTDAKGRARQIQARTVKLR